MGLQQSARARISRGLFSWGEYRRTPSGRHFLCVCWIFDNTGMLLPRPLPRTDFLVQMGGHRFSRALYDRAGIRRKILQALDICANSDAGYLNKKYSVSKTNGSACSCRTFTLQDRAVFSQQIWQYFLHIHITTHQSHE